MTERLTGERAVLERIKRQSAESRHQEMVKWGWKPVVAGIMYVMEADDFFKKKEEEILGSDGNSHESSGPKVEPTQLITPRHYESRYNRSRRPLSPSTQKLRNFLRPAR